MSNTCNGCQHKANSIRRICRYGSLNILEDMGCSKYKPEPKPVIDDNLKPCPFCGGKAVRTFKRGGYRVECEHRQSTCPVNMRTHHHDTAESADKAWNTRPVTIPTASINAVARWFNDAFEMCFNRNFEDLPKHTQDHWIQTATQFLKEFPSIQGKYVVGIDLAHPDGDRTVEYSGSITGRIVGSSGNTEIIEKGDSHD